MSSDLEVSPSASPRLSKITSSFSDLDLSSLERYQERKENTERIRKKLHEKLSLIDKYELSDRIDMGDEFGDDCRVSSKKHDLRKKFRENREFSESSDEFDFVDDPPCKNSKIWPNHPIISSAVSVLSKSRFSSGQNSSATRGVTASVFEKKYKLICEKALHTISDIRTLLGKGTPNPDGDEDINRREVRVKEFSSRFSRNYLYPLVRQLEDLNQRNHPSPLANRKMLSAYQYVHHGLQAYHAHLPTSTGDCCVLQLRSMMISLIDLCEIHRKHVGNDEEEYVLEFIDTFKINAELTIQKIDEFQTTNEQNNKKIENPEVRLKNQPSNKNGIKKNCTGNRFSMYSMTAAFRKDVHWKKAVENLAKKKFNVKSKYKTATYKHRPPVQKDVRPVPYLQKFPFYCSANKSSMLKNSPVTPAQVDENNITTMVEKMEQDGHGCEGENENNQAQNNHLLLKLLQSTGKNHEKDENENPKNDQNLTELLNLVQKEGNAAFLQKVLDGLKKGEDVPKLTLEIVQSQTSIPSEDEKSKPKSQRKEPKIIISGEKNARLICITDDNSVLEPCPDEDQPEQNEFRDINCQTESSNPPPNPKIVIRTSSETQTEVDARDNNQVVSKATQKGKNGTNIKISRLKRNERPLEQLDKKYALNIIQYKLDFYKRCKGNPIYKRSTECQPCVLLEKILNELLNESLLEVAKEIELNDIAERVYKAELTL